MLEILGRLGNPQTALPALAKDAEKMAAIEAHVRSLPSRHELRLADARDLSEVPDASIQLVVTSPPYWTLKRYSDLDGQLGHVQSYDEFLDELDRVWREVWRVLVPGGRLVCVVGDVCLSRRRNHGRHQVVPLHASIEEHCRLIGFDGLAPIIWYKISNAVHEVERGGGFLGKPYEPNAVVKNDVEYILMQRKPGGYRSPSVDTRVLSLISESNHRKWFQQVWSGLTGASTRQHPAPFPLELAERLVRMFSFVGDVVLDPFTGTGTTNVAAARWGRDSVGYDIDGAYLDIAERRLTEESVHEVVRTARGAKAAA